MTTEEPGTPRVAELARQLSDTLSRISELAVKLDTQYVRKDVFDLAQRLLQTAIDAVTTHNKSLETQIKDFKDSTISKEAAAAMQDRIDKLENANTWLVRLVIGIVVTAIIGAFITTQGIGGR